MTNDKRAPVKRYYLSGGALHEAGIPDVMPMPKFVDESDYDALLAENERLREANYFLLSGIRDYINGETIEAEYYFKNMIDSYKALQEVGE